MSTGVLIISDCLFIQFLILIQTDVDQELHEGPITVRPAHCLTEKNVACCCSA